MIGAGLIARWRERRDAQRALPGIVADLRARVGELERWRLAAAKVIAAQHQGLMRHRYELKALGATLECNPAWKNRLRKNRERILQEALVEAAAAERAAETPPPPEIPATDGDATEEGATVHG